MRLLGAALVATALAACETGGAAPEYNSFGSFTDLTATRSSATPGCTAQSRVGDWLVFATSYKYEFTSTSAGQTTYGRDDRGVIKLGWDPDPSIDFTTTDLNERWSSRGAPSRPSPSLGEFELYLNWQRNLDESSAPPFNNTTTFDIAIGIPPSALNATADQAMRGSPENLAVTFQFADGPQWRGAPNSTADGSIMWFLYDSVWASIADSYSDREKQANAARLIEFLFQNPQPDSVVEISVSHPSAGLMYSGRIDFRDAREAFGLGVQAYQNFSRLGCGRV